MIVRSYGVMTRRLPYFFQLLVFILGLVNVSGQEKIYVAGVTTLYQKNTHADVLLGRVLETDTLDKQGRESGLKLVSLYVDQIGDDDISGDLSRQYGFPVFDQVGETLMLGKNQLSVEGVILVAEHGDYPRSDVGQTIYPKRRLFGEVFKVFEKSGRVVPLFSDKHLSDNWKEAKWIYDTARRLKVPLMAGSSVPSAWRFPPIDVKRGAELQEIVAVAYGPLDAYGFHALEMVQALAERRKGGETGVGRVRCIRGDQVWKGELFDRDLFDDALGRLKERPIPVEKRVEEMVKEPALFQIEYLDGLKASVLILNGAVEDFTAAWRYKKLEETSSTVFWLQPVRPFHHFAHLLSGIEKFMQTKQATWPVERTLLTTGVLDALHLSKAKGGEWLETPYLDIRYTSHWNWSQPPPAPPEEKRGQSK